MQFGTSSVIHLIQGFGDVNMIPLFELGSPRSSYLNYYQYQKNKTNTMEEEIGKHTHTFRYH